MSAVLQCCNLLGVPKSVDIAKLPCPFQHRCACSLNICLTYHMDENMQMYVHGLMHFVLLKINISSPASISTSCACVMQGAKDHTLLSMETLLASPLGSAHDPLPTRRVDIDLSPVSLVLGTPMMCYPNSPLEFQLLNGNSWKSRGTAVGGSGQSFKGDVVAAVQPNIQAELQDAKVSANSFVPLCRQRH